MPAPGSVSVKAESCQENSRKVKDRNGIFGSTERRFATHSSQAETPGPGHYTTTSDTNLLRKAQTYQRAYTHEHGRRKDQSLKTEKPQIWKDVIQYESEYNTIAGNLQKKNNQLSNPLLTFMTKQSSSHTQMPKWQVKQQ